MSKIKLIIQREFITKVKSKSFILMTFLSPLIMIGIFFLIFFLSKKSYEKIKEIVYVDNSGIFSKDNFKDTKSIKYQDYTKLGIEKVKKKVEEGYYYGALFIPKKDSLEVLAKSIEFYSKQTPTISTINNIEAILNKNLGILKMTKLGLNLEKLKASKIHSKIQLYNFSGEESLKESNFIKIIAGFILAGLLIIFVMTYGGFVMKSVIEEKTSRIIEIIVSSVKPFQLMLGKIIGSASAGLLQFFIWGILLFILTTVVFSVFGVNMGEIQASTIPAEQLEAAQKAVGGGEIQLLIQEILRLPILKLFFLFIFYFIGGYLLYSSFFAAIGAAIDNETDSQQFVTPLIVPVIFSIYLGPTVIMNDPHGSIAVIFSYFPLTSPSVMLMRVPFGVSWWEIILSMLLLILSIIVTVWLASKIYRIGILMYGKKPTYKDLWKWIRYNI